MKKTFYLILALACAPLCTTTPVYASPQTVWVERNFPEYTKAELRYLLVEDL